METIDEIEAPEAVLDFWLNDVGPDRWYAVEDDVDNRITERFMATWRAAKNGDLDHWMLRPRHALALVILLDQFPRNMFRGSSVAFSSDGRALCIAKKALSDGHDLKAAEPERQFFYLPLMHSESLVDQDRCVRLFLTRMPQTGARNLPFAREHRDVIRQFGRFPYRNEALGRRSTPAEQDFLKSYGDAA
ncbi:MAG: DUF924 family protein [Pseudomonadota bacterium]